MLSILDNRVNTITLHTTGVYKKNKMRTMQVPLHIFHHPQHWECLSTPHSVHCSPQLLSRMKNYSSKFKKKKTNCINTEIASIKIQNLELLQGSLLPQQLCKWGMAYFLQSVRDSRSSVKTIDMGTAHCKRRKSEIRKWNEASVGSIYYLFSQFWVNNLSN